MEKKIIPSEPRVSCDRELQRVALNLCKKQFEDELMKMSAIKHHVRKAGNK